ncbi:class I adenylate-forming enzyme family protein [Paenibacillus sp. FSL W7-1279]|uniref:class I adenylate-forming enzyme family protein n=1 Tax=unclassified Paenibacillus TaxID=185978 RepID=UPI0030D59DDC
MYMSTNTIQSVFTETARKYPDNIAVIWNNESITYDSLLEEALKLSNKLGNPTNISVCLHNPIFYYISYLAILFSGSVVVPVSIKSTVQELKNHIRETNSTILITDREDVLLDREEFNIKILNYSEKETFINNDRDIRYLKDGTAVLIPTSGTSGKSSKIVQLSHSGLLWVAKRHNNRVFKNSIHKTLIILPLTSSFVNTTQLLAQLILGGTSVVYSKPFFPRDIYKLIKEHGIYSLGCVPTHLHLMNRYPPKDPDLLSSLKFIISAGDYTPAQELIEARKKLPNTKIIKAYGLTEAGPRVSCTDPDSDIYPSTDDKTVGRPFEGIQLRIITENNELCKTNQIGEILINSPGNMIGYYNNPVASREVLNNNWLRTGDLGYLNEKGELCIIGRKKNVILVGGNTIYPEEIEEFLVKQKDILDAAVYGKKDPILGELIIALLVTNNADDNSITELKKICQQNLSPYKIPHYFYNVNKIPRNENGKIIRQKLSYIE